ncbi:MAG: hypothetical protein WC292_01410 [Clostridia bacterium]
MAKKFNAAQFKNQMRQAQNKVNQEIRKINHEIDKYNRDVNSAVNKYNQEVRRYNSQVRQNRARIDQELRKLLSQPTFRVTTTYTTSVKTLNSAYGQVSSYYDAIDYPSEFEDRFYSDIEQENANNLETANAIINGAREAAPAVSLQDTAIIGQLIQISIDLDNRWRGALFSLSPANPDATRHFCTSAREIFTEIFNAKAPDKVVFAEYPNCEKTSIGNATRRSKIKYLLGKKGISNPNAESFVEEDINNILELFHILNDGTHGEARRYSFDKLYSVKKRVEDGLLFLCNIVS